MKRWKFFIVCFSFLFSTSCLKAQPFEDWSKRYTFAENYQINALTFYDSTYGWAAGWKHTSKSGSEAVVLYTENGGRNWSEQLIDSTYSWFNDITFLDKKHGWVVGYCCFYSTSDGGQNWQKIPDSLFQFEGFTGLGDIEFVSFAGTLNGLIGSTDGTLARTEDGGKTWNCSPLVPENGCIDTLNYGSIINADTACTVGNGGVAVTTDGGKSWQATHIEMRNYQKCVFINDTTGWVLSRESQILRTHDAGQTWENLGQIYEDFSMVATDIAFLDSSTGWVITNTGTVWKTQDGGLTWKAEIVSSNCPLNSIDVVPSERFGVLIDADRNFYTSKLILSGLEKDKFVPQAIELFPNYPNPFNQTTNITYFLPRDQLVNLSIYDIQGKLVDVLATGLQQEGSHTVKWNAASYSSGVYIIKLQAGREVKICKSIFLK